MNTQLRKPSVNAQVDTNARSVDCSHYSEQRGLRRKNDLLAQRLNIALLTYIETNLHRPIPVNTLAEQIGLSQAYFSRIFARYFGMSPHRYVTFRRTERAKQMLLTTDAPLVRIALDCGLFDQPHFNRVFRKFTGYAPGVWRRAQLERDD